MLAGCGSPRSGKETETNSELKKDSVEPVKHSLVTLERAKIITTEAGSPKSTQAKQAKIFQANSNQKTIFISDSAMVPPDLFVVAPGDENHDMPLVTKLKQKVVACKQPLPTLALAPRFKDAAISNIQYIDVEQGMKSSFVRSLLFDKNGNLWIGTNGAGVSCYDGASFKNYSEENGLSNNTILSIMQDKSGNIWFGTEGGGACCFDGHKFSWIRKEEGMSNNTILAMCEDKSGKIWFGTNGDGVCCYDGKTITTYDKASGLSNNTVRTIYEDTKGNIWFGTNGWGACYFDGKSFTYFGTGAGLSSKIIHSILEDDKGNIWLATDDAGVNIYNRKDSTLKYLTKQNGLSSDCIISLHKSKDGTVWMGTYDGGLCGYANGKLKLFSMRDGLSNNYVLCIKEDLAGNIWMGTYGGGICRYDGSSFSHFTKEEGLGSNTVRAIAEKNNGNLWFGTYGDGAILYDGTNFLHYTESEGLSSNYVKALAIDNKDQVWIGTDGGGAIRFNGKTFENFTESEGLCSNYILSLFKDASGKIWIGTDGAGVCCYTGTSFMSFDNEILNKNSVTSISQDKFGNIWFATDEAGACSFDGEFFRWYGTKEGLCSNNLKTIIADHEGNIWLGTEGNGISVLKATSIKTRNPEFINYNDKNELSSNSIRSLVQDKNNHVWIATEKGLNYFTEKEGKTKIHAYTTANGLKANNFFPNGVLIDKNNKIWWGNGKALTSLNLNLFKLPNNAPAIQLNSIELEQTFIDFYALSDSLKGGHPIVVGDLEKKDISKVKFSGVAPFFNYPENLELPYYLDHVTFHFSAIDWAAPDRIQYQYMLQGLDKDWSPLITDEKAFYGNLPYGEYVFKVKAIGLAQKWSNVLEYKFRIKAPWWKTWWAYTLYVISFFGAVYLFTRWRTRQLLIQQKKLEQTIEERTAEIVEQKELVEEKQKEIVDSINYAKRIQGALLASDNIFDENLKDYFILFNPKDIVSGDFYWASHLANGNFALITADSTGHGVPGAMMSMLNISCLNEAINERKIIDPAEILNYVRNRIIQSLSHDGSLEGGKDGMDCSLIDFDFKKKKITYAAANNPIWIIRKDGDGVKQIIELKSDRMPVGKHEKDSVSFTSHVFDLQKGDVVYALTDGYPDQFGGPKGKKFTYKRLKELLIENSAKSVAEQKEILNKNMQSWKGTLEQVDDILLIGVKI